ncbi:MAG: SGNH/GDSL hydrolase family protein [Chloroflexi bacterium]|nr:SGNH/GDSL hydrolase family protein [Chloroflexota bacterium]
MHRLTRLLLPAILALTVVGWPLAAPTLAAPPELLYLALGDSVPSGADLSDGIGYPYRLGQRLADASGRPVRLLNRARAGERSDGVLSSQMDDVRAIQPELVSVTVGANDFLVPAFECASATVDKNPQTRCDGMTLLRAVPQYESNLRAILHRLFSETGATIIVTTYFNPFPRGSACAPGTTDAALRFLNSTISDVAAEFAPRTMVVDLAPLFKGHEGREPTGWFSQSSLRVSCTDIHPNADGHDAIATAIWGGLAPRLALAP